MVFVIFVILGLMAFGFFGFIFMGMMGSADRKVQRNAEQILDETFNGRKKTAVYKVTSIGGTLKFEQVLAGAEKRGYELHAQNRDSDSLTTLVFKKVD